MPIFRKVKDKPEVENVSLSFDKNRMTGRYFFAFDVLFIR